MENITQDYGSYGALVASCGVELLLEGSVGDWEGDLFFLLRDGDRFGLLVTGYGSCSGCDALEASWGDLDALTALRDALWASVTWGTRGEILEYLQDTNAHLQWWGHEGGFGEFQAQACELLGA